MMTGLYYNINNRGPLMDSTKTFNRNEERKAVYSQLIRALERKDKKTVDNLVLKIGIFASKPTDIGFSIHDLKVFLRLTEHAIQKYSHKFNYHGDKVRKINTRIAKASGNINRTDIVKRNDEHFWQKIYGKKLAARERIKTILLDQLRKRHVTVVEIELEYRDNHPDHVSAIHKALRSEIIERFGVR
jgi:hypothetical protein